jgi:hypothetical protein
MANYSHIAEVCMKGLWVILVGALLVLSACNSEKEVSKEVKKPGNAGEVAPGFVPPADGKISDEQAQKYVQVSGELVRLQERWVQEMQNADETQKLKLSNQFSQAKNELCIQLGLAGGYQEYIWIDKVALSDANNQATASKHGIAIINTP